MLSVRSFTRTDSSLRFYRAECLWIGWRALLRSKDNDGGDPCDARALNGSLVWKCIYSAM